LEALKLLHMEAGGNSGDPTWSKAVGAYAGIDPLAYLQSAAAFGRLPSLPSAATLSTPTARRPALPHDAGSKPTASTGGPRVQIGTVNVQTQATDANGIAAGINRALERKLLVSTSDPGLA